MKKNLTSPRTTCDGLRKLTYGDVVTSPNPSLLKEIKQEPKVEVDPLSDYFDEVDVSNIKNEAVDYNEEETVFQDVLDTKPILLVKPVLVEGSESDIGTDSDGLDRDVKPDLKTLPPIPAEI